MWGLEQLRLLGGPEEERTIMFSYTQYESALRWVMNVAGVWLVTHGVGNDALWEAVGGAVLSLSPFVWGLLRHSKYGTILAANDIPEVAGVIMKPGAAGEALSRSIPKDAVTTAGTAAAINIGTTGKV
jgi:hypothetical protein